MRRIKKIVFWMLGVILFLTFITYALFYIKRDSINRKIISEVNTYLEGELAIKSVDFSLFSAFPEASLILDSVVLYEHKSGLIDVKLNPILTIYRLNLAIDVLEILKGDILVNKFILEGGVANLVNYNDSTLNLLNALGSSEVDTSAVSEPISMKLNLVEINNLQLNYIDSLSNQYVSTKLNSLNTTIQLESDSLNGNVALDFQLDSLLINNKRLLKKHTLALNTKFKADLKTTALSFADGILKVDLLETNFSGVYNYSDSGFVDMSISASHEDLFELAKLEVLNPDYLPDVRKGELLIDAQIKGNTIGGVPVVKANAKLKDLQVYNAFGKVIEKAEFKLNLFSGSDSAMRDGKLLVDSLFVSFASGGFVHGKLEINNFETPEFSVNWNANEQLDDLYRIFKIPGVNKISGSVHSTASLQGKINLASQKLQQPKGSLMFTIENCHIELSDSNYPIENINGTFYMINGGVKMDAFSLKANGNNIALSGNIDNLLPYLLQKPTQLVVSLSVQSSYLNSNDLLAFDKELLQDSAIIIRGLDVSLKGEIASSALSNYQILPSGKLAIKKFSAQVEGAPLVDQFHGEIKVDKNVINFNNFRGIIGKSAVDFSISVANYADFFQSDSTSQITADIALKSERVNVKDFFTLDNKFVLPKNYEEEVLENVVLNTKFITTNKELQKTDLLPEFEFQFTGIQFQTLHSPVLFKDIFIFGLIQNNNVYLNSMFGKFGRSDVFMNAEFDNVLATKDTISRVMKSRVSFNSGVLDLNELIKLDAAALDVETTEEVSSTSNPFADDFPVTDFNVNIGELVYYDAVIHNLGGIIKIEENNKVKMEHVKLESGEFGHFEFDGTLDASSHTEGILSSTIKISNVNLSNLNVKYVQNDEEVEIGDHFSGILNGTIVANVPILQDFSFDLARLTGKVKVKLIDGALINYAPLKEMAAYFKNKDLNNIRFDELKNTMIFNKGKMLLPFMTINTTLGTINLMGFQTLDYDMNYDIQVPIKLVAGSALNSLFVANKEDDEKDDKVKKAGKGKYVTIKITGGIDNYTLKLGKKHILTAPAGFEMD